MRTAVEGLHLLLPDGETEVCVPPCAAVRVPEVCAAPARAGDLAWYRWIVGHQATFLEWSLLREVLTRPGPVSEGDVVALLDLYSALLLYAGSCPPEQYRRVIRPRMARAHPAFSGEWARDHRGLPRLLGQAADTGLLGRAVRRNHRVHNAVALRLIPEGVSLLRQAGRSAGGEPSRAELDVYDRFFLSGRGAVCTHVLEVQLLHRLLRIVADLESCGLYYGGEPVSAVVPGEFRAETVGLEQSAVSRFRRQAAVLALSVRDHAPPLPSDDGGVMKLVKDVELTEELRRYMVGHGTPPDPVARDLIARTQALGQVAEMQIPPEQGALLTLLARLMGARTVVEVGTFTGYSTLCLARGVVPGGCVVTCDLNGEWTDIAREAWERAGVADRIDLRLGPASETLAALPGEPGVDLVFIDADKGGYIGYWEQLVPRLRPGGLIVADNVFYGGAVVDADAVGNAAAIQAFNDHALADDRMELVMLPVADGVTLARRLPATDGGTP